MVKEMNKRHFIWYFIKIILVFSIGYAFRANAADAIPALSIGDFANNILEPAAIAADLFYIVYYCAGTAFMTASAIKFFEYRVNPLSARMSQVVFLFLTGFCMLAAPYLLTHLDEGVTSAVALESIFHS